MWKFNVWTRSVFARIQGENLPRFVESLFLYYFIWIPLSSKLPLPPSFFPFSPCTQCSISLKFYFGKFSALFVSLLVAINKYNQSSKLSPPYKMSTPHSPWSLKSLKLYLFKIKFCSICYFIITMNK